jgi:hypothetical protein
MRYYFYISDDKSHDNYFVQQCLLLDWDNKVTNGFRPNQHKIWYDGCNLQFKSKVPSGILLVGTLILLVGAFVCGVFLALAMEKVHMMELGEF